MPLALEPEALWMESQLGLDWPALKLDREDLRSGWALVGEFTQSWAILRLAVAARRRLENKRLFSNIKMNKIDVISLGSLRNTTSFTWRVFILSFFFEKLSR